MAGVASVCAPVKFRNRSLAFVQVLHSLNRLTEWTYKEEGLVPFRPNAPEHPDISYASVPIRGLFELRRAIDEMDRRLPDVRCPVAVLHASDDPEVDPDSARHIHDRLGSPRKSIHFVAAERHGIIRDDIGDTRSRLLSFLARVSEPVAAAAPAPAAVRRRLALPATVLRPFRFLAPRTAPAADAPHAWEKSYPPGLDWRAPIAPRPLTALFDEAVKAYADRTAMSFRGKHYRYRDLARLVDRTAKGLQALGVGRGTRVGLLLPNCPYAVICFHAVLKAGGIVVNINPLYAKYEIERQLVDSGARILFTLDLKGLYDKVDDLARSGGPLDKLVVCPMRGVLRFTEKVMFGFLKGNEIAAVVEDDRHLPFYRLMENDGAVTPPDIDPSTEVAVLQYTGGTTGMPKGAQLTHANLSANVEQLLLWAPDVVRGAEKTLAVLPIFHSFGMTAVMNMGLAIGAEIILQPRFQTRDVLQAVARERATILIGVPTMFSAMNAVRDIAKYDLKSLKFCISGGAPLPAAVQDRFESLSGCRLLEGYGLSEASPVCTINPLSGGKPGSVGLPLPGTTIEIVALDDPDRLLGPNMRGEICISGPQVMVGYANRAEDNVDIFRGMRLHTGDVGYLDDDGYLFIVDRIKDLILSGGFNVYPRQVEEILHMHPAVEEVAVCGVADPHRGEIVKAFVKTRDGMTLTAGELKAFCKERLAPFQTPREIEFRDTLPKTLIGKIAKKELLAEETARLAARPPIDRRDRQDETMKNVVIAGYVRSPFTPANKGDLRKVRPDDLAAQVVNGLVRRVGIDAGDVEDLILGCAFPEGEQGLNVARLVVFLAGLPQSVAGATVNRFCGSSMQAIHMAAGAIQMGAGEAFICAGVECMTRVPMMGFNPMPNPKLCETYPQAYISMGETAENLATPLPDHARRAGGVRRRVPQARRRRTERRTVRRRDRPDRDGRRHDRPRRLHPRRHDGGGPRRAEAGLRCQGHGDGRHRRRR